MVMVSAPAVMAGKMPPIEMSTIMPAAVAATKTMTAEMMASATMTRKMTAAVVAAAMMACECHIGRRKRPDDERRDTNQNSSHPMSPSGYALLPVKKFRSTIKREQAIGSQHGAIFSRASRIDMRRVKKSDEGQMFWPDILGSDIFENTRGHCRVVDISGRHQAPHRIAEIDFIGTRKIARRENGFMRPALGNQLLTQRAGQQPA